ncbi:hypothetical protein [Sanguibacter massiliensis]|uniref:hypothetical protein n=1 Tax=Sanguibacter massiliensis TaxID=1973217 RepID=UPI00101ADC93|nr:hypothetical protein [Sanguibacter massiliensis]
MTTATTKVRLRDHSPAVRALLAGSLVSLVGTEIFEITALMLTTAAYGALLSTGALGVAMRLAPMVLSPVITAALDRSPERRASFARLTVLVRGVAIGLFAGLLALSSPPTWAAYALIAAIAALDTANLSSVRATIPQLVTDGQGRDARLSDATSRLIAQWNGVQILVPPVVVAVLAWLDLPAMAIIAAAMLLAAFAMLGAPVRLTAATSWPPSPETTMLGRLRSGFQVVALHPVARSVTVLGAVSGATVFTFSLAVPVVVVGRAPQIAVGAALGAMAVGSLVSARWAARFSTRAQRLRAMFGAATLQLVVLLAMSGATSPRVVGVALVLAALLTGAAAGVLAVSRSTLLQSEFEASVLGGLFVTVTALSQVLMPVLPWVWESMAAGSGGLPRAFVILAAVQGVGTVIALADLWRHDRASAAADGSAEGAS